MNQLDDMLLTPRREITFRKVPGRVEYAGSYAPKLEPVVITEGNQVDYTGLSSGTRSGLLSLDDTVLKIKGCRIGDSLAGSDFARERRVIGGRPARWNTDLNHIDAEGGQLLSVAENEIRQTLEYNRIFAREGFETVYTPVAIIHYGKKFASRTYTPNKAFFDLERRAISEKMAKILDWFDRVNYGIEELAASVMQVRGDTRLPEIYRHAIKNDDAVKEFAYLAGLSAGAQKKTTEDILYWSFGATHMGNYVLFANGKSLFLSMVDFEGAGRYKGSLRALFKSIRNRNEKRVIIRSLDFSGFRWVEGIRGSTEGIAPASFKQGFTQGFDEGYSNPDKRKPMAIGLLSEAFHLG